MFAPFFFVSVAAYLRQPRFVASGLSASRIRLLPMLALSLILGGCGEAEPEHVATYPVETAVTFQGKPIPGAFVALHPKQPMPEVPTPRASVNIDGALIVTTFNGGDGAPAGEYIVTVEWYKPIKSGADVVPGPNVLPSKYASPKTSDLLITVSAESNKLPPIDL